MSSCVARLSKLNKNLSTHPWMRASPLSLPLEVVVIVISLKQTHSITRAVNLPINELWRFLVLPSTQIMPCWQSLCLWQPGSPHMPLPPLLCFASDSAFKHSTCCKLKPHTITITLPKRTHPGLCTSLHSQHPDSTSLHLYIFTF